MCFMLFIIIGVLIIAFPIIKDYLLSVAESSATTTSSKRSNSNEQSHSEQLDTTCFELGK